MKQLVMDFVEVTEAAAVAAFPWIGRGEKHLADEAATSAMRKKLNDMSMDAVIVIGEGELDEAPMLYIGEHVGNGNGPKLDIAVDPIEGTNLIVNGQGNSIAVIAAARKGTLLHAPDMYMEKIAVGPKAAGKIDIDAPLLNNVKAVADANGKKITEVNVAIQDRERHREMIQLIREAGGRVHLFSEGDVTWTVAVALENTDIDMFIGIGGAPEGVVSAVALKCLGGEMQARLLPGNKAEFDRCVQMGLADPRAPLRLEQLVNSDECIFVATGITDSLLLKGIRTINLERKITQSLLTFGNSKKAHFIETIY